MNNQDKIAVIAETIGIEGEYSNNPSDRGGPTRWGVTESTARAHGYKGDMKDYPKESAALVYAVSYIDKPKFDQVYDVSPLLGKEMIDTGVNMGPHAATIFLQRSLNVLNLQGRIYLDIAADGNLGPASLGALRAYLAYRKNGVTVLLRMLNALQGAKYIELAEKDKKQEDFIHGWFTNRVVI